MIATILPSSSSFHAVSYNESKVANGSAFLIEIKNFGGIDTFGYDSPQELVKYLTEYSSQNSRIKKPQFHIAFSCKGDEMSYEELLDFAHDYLKEMGYGEDGQPLLVYGHTDTENNHIHIITSRVDPKGRKINDSNERIRSQKVLEKLLGNNEKFKLDLHLNDMKNYNFRSITQYKAILESLGYECYDKNSSVYIKKGGMVIGNIPTKDIDKMIEVNKRNFKEPNYAKLYGLISKYKNLNTDLDGLQNDLRKMFGLSLVFFGRKDSPYGYCIVDFNNKAVYEGSKVMNINKLKEFLSTSERINRIESFIKQMIDAQPNINQRYLNKKLKRLKAYISKGEIHFNGKKVPLENSINERIALNNKLEWIDSFHPQSKDEYMILMKFANIKENEISLPTAYNRHQYNEQLIENIKEIFNSNNIDDIKTKLDNAGYKLITYNDKNYIYSSKDRALVDLDRINVRLPQSISGKLSSGANIGSGNRDTSNSLTTNREWEVGSNEKWDDVDNRIKY